MLLRDSCTMNHTMPRSSRARKREDREVEQERRDQRAPTEAQLCYLTSLYAKCSRPYRHPANRGEASVAITWLKRLQVKSAPRSPEPIPTDSQLHDIAVLARRLNVPVPTVETKAAASRTLVLLKRASEQESHSASNP
jgi:hypothetical protein